MNYDAIVIGGGISGCAAAYYLSCNSLSVALVEKDDIAAHASGFAFGSLHTRFQPPATSPPIECFRAESIELHHELSETLPEESGVDYQFQEKAALVLTFDESEAAMLRPSGVSAFLRDTWPQNRQDVRWLEYGELSHIDARISTDVIGALYLGGTTEISPGSFSNAFWTAAERHGARMINAEVTEINVVDNVVSGVSTSCGELNGSAVVLAAGPWSGKLLRQSRSTSFLNLPVSPLKGEILRYDLGDEPPIPVSLWWGSDYASSKPDGLLYVGTTHSESGFDEEPSEAGRDEVKSSAECALPFLAGKRIVRQTACLRPSTPDGLPIIGAFPNVEGLIISTGGGPIGIELGPSIGKWAADVVMDQEERWSRFRGFGPDRFV